MMKSVYRAKVLIELGGKTREPVKKSPKRPGSNRKLDLRPTILIIEDDRLSRKCRPVWSIKKVTRRFAQQL